MTEPPRPANTGPDKARRRLGRRRSRRRARCAGRSARPRSSRDDRRLDRRRLWRHRHQPALRVARIAVARRQGRHSDRRSGDRRDFAAALRAYFHGDGQICRVPDAGGQSRRGRHSVADGAGADGAGTARGTPRQSRLSARRRRRRVVLGRRHHHARDFRAFGGRGPRSRHPSASTNMSFRSRS